MNIIIFLFVMLINCVFCCSCFSVKQGRVFARQLRRLIRERPPSRSWKHLNKQVQNRRRQRHVRPEQMSYLINLTHTTVNIIDIWEPFSMRYPKVKKSNFMKKIREISLFEERDPSPFFYYQKQVRPRIQARLKNLSKEEITQKIHKQWENLKMEEKKKYLDQAEQQKGKDRPRFYVKENILWDHRYTYDLKKLPDFRKPAIIIQKHTRGWIARRRLRGDSSHAQKGCLGKCCRNSTFTPIIFCSCKCTRKNKKES